MYEKGKSTRMVNVRFSPEHRTQLHAVAKAKRRNLSDTVRILIEDAYAELQKVKQTPQLADSELKFISDGGEVMVEIVTQVKKIDEAISALERERMRVQRQDVEYAEYLDEFDVQENGRRWLSIQEFRRYQAELEAINERFRQVDPRSAAFDEVWKQNIRRVIELETLLLA